MAKVRVRFTQDMPGRTYDRFNVKAGDVLELEAHQAEDVIAQGFAEKAGKPTKRRGGTTAEVAVEEPSNKR